MFLEKPPFHIRDETNLHKVHIVNPVALASQLGHTQCIVLTYKNKLYSYKSWYLRQYLHVMTVVMGFQWFLSYEWNKFVDFEGVMSFQTSCSIVQLHFQKIPCKLETIWYLGRVDLGRVSIWDELT